jgi:hypothetical protein
LGDDPFPGLEVRDVVFGAERIEEVATADAEGGFEGGRGVEEPCVDDLEEKKNTSSQTDTHVKRG